MQLLGTATKPPILERALLAGKACSLAFVPANSIAREPYAEDLTCLAQVEDPNTFSGATMFTTSSGELVIACRGSANAKNFATNLNIGPVELSEGPVGAQVHKGFQSAATTLWRMLEPYVPPTASRVFVTGHSLGGGVATLIALKARSAGLQPELVTVAGPRLGNGAFAEYYRSRCAHPAVHLVHDDDAVLSSNTKIWDDLGFEHVGNVVRCASDEPCIYEDGPEDATCFVGGAPAAGSSGPPSLKGIFVDHCQYLGLYIGVRLEHPSVWLRGL